MPEPRDYIRLERAADTGNGRPAPRPYTWRGGPPEHPGLCGGCGFLVTAKAHRFMCGGWQEEGPGYEWYAELAGDGVSA